MAPSAGLMCMQMAVVHFGGLGTDPSRLIQRFDSTVNPATRHQLVDQMQVILANDLPELPLYIPEQVTFVNTKVYNGWAYTPGCPPCGAGMNKRILVSGSAAPVSGA